jgi:tetratricopeptide (TPR) repeat protein
VRTRLSRWVWWLTLPVILCLYRSSLSSQSSQSSSGGAMEREFQAAMGAEDRGDLDQAESLLTELHRAHPGIFSVDESLGMLYAGREDFTRALPLLQAAVREQPSSDAAHVNLGATLYRLQRDEPAREEFERAVRINPKNVSAQESLGRLSMETRRPDEAAKALLTALQLQPEDRDLKLDCVTALLGANRLDEAGKMLASFPGADQSARAQSLMGEADEKQGKFEEAGKHFDRAVQLEPNEENAWDLGLEFLRHWTFDAAIKEFQAASLKFPGSNRLRLGLGAALFGAEQFDRAIPVFADLLESDLGNATYAELLGISCNALAETTSPRCGALVTYAQAHTSDAKAAAYAASFLMKRNDNDPNLDLARKLVENALAADPNLPNAQFQMGVILQESQDWKGSIPYLERAVKLKPDYAQAHYRLARAYWKTGRRQDGDAQMELQKKFQHQEEEDLDRRLNEIMVFNVKAQ